MLYLGGNGWVNVFSLTEVRLSVGGLHLWHHTVSQHLEEYLWWSEVHPILRWCLKGSCRMNIFKTLDVWRQNWDMTSHILWNNINILGFSASNQFQVGPYLLIQERHFRGAIETLPIQSWIRNSVVVIPRSTINTLVHTHKNLKWVK